MVWRILMARMPRRVSCASQLGLSCGREWAAVGARRLPPLSWSTPTMLSKRMMALKISSGSRSTLPRHKLWEGRLPERCDDDGPNQRAGQELGGCNRVPGLYKGSTALTPNKPFLRVVGARRARLDSTA